jgi:hypothetical protein
MQTQTKQADVTITQSVDQWLFRPNNEHAEGWLKANSISGHWIGGTLVVPTRLVKPALAVMNACGLTTD